MLNFHIIKKSIASSLVIILIRNLQVAIKISIGKKAIDIASNNFLGPKWVG